MDLHSGRFERNLQDGVQHMTTPIEDPGGASATVQVFHSLWNGVLTAFGVLLFWNWRNVVSTLNHKASIKDLDDYKAISTKDLDDHKADTDHRFEYVHLMLNRLVDNQAVQHAQKTERLDKILSEVYRVRGSQQ